MDLKFSSGKQHSGISSHYLVHNDSSISLFETYEPTPPEEIEVRLSNSANSTVKKFNF